MADQMKTADVKMYDRKYFVREVNEKFNDLYETLVGMDSDEADKLNEVWQATNQRLSEEWPAAFNEVMSEDL